ncbi:YolD-like family protein [Halalkalibacter krulwichiae]|uniref:YolD-like protein n=1 Tax=Halalkalibacter krulwichiae TaxID=199441 RepID=A0A1X9MB24_9BACI|nr:YolD-like family protein [Halalkalibacter krulwichiae]ARK30617.1 YolD-like protein [Halalkalibacter krulwichiae]
MNQQEHLQRGNILWESSRMFLPEHKQALLHRKQEIKKVEKPELDEQEWQEIGIIVFDSLKHELDVKVIYWNDGFFHELVGIIDKVDLHLKRIKIRIGEDIDFIAIDCLKTIVRMG